MGIRLVKYGVNNDLGTFDHNELLNRDLEDQHPIESITGLREELENITGINDTIDTSSLALVYNPETKELTGNVKIFNSEDNALTVKTTGLYVDKYLDLEIEDTPSVHLTVEGKGETLQTMYNTGTRFSHYGTFKNIYNASEANAWYYDSNLGSFVQPQNTTTFTGFVSTVRYRTYTHRATLTSTNSDNDGIGVIVAYVLDDAGNPNTLSFVVNKGGEAHVGNYYYALVYNKNLPNEEILFTKGNKAGGTIPGNHSTSGWSKSSITVEVSKSGSVITCAASNYNSTDINIATTIEIDLDDYSWGHLFREKVQYGYCAQSQPSSYFTNIFFVGKGPLQAFATISKESDNLLKIINDGLYVPTPEFIMKVSSEEDNAIELKPDGVYLSNENLSGQSSQFRVTQTNHGFKVGDALYNSTTGYLKGLANETNSVEIVGIVSEVINENIFRLCTSGFLATSVFNKYNNGTVLFLSDTTDGLLIDIESGYISKPIATKIDNGIIVNIQRGIVYGPDEDNKENIAYVIEGKIGDIKHSIDNIDIRTDGYVLFKNGKEYPTGQIQELLDVASEDFINTYIIINENSITFKNTEQLNESVYYNTEETDGNLYIKAFSCNNEILTNIPVGNIITTLSVSNFANYIPLDGRECTIKDYPILASYIFNTYGSYTHFGGDGYLTFGLPNLNTTITDTNENLIQTYYYIKYR